MKLGFKEVPWEASLFFIGWIWLGFSMFGMTLVNMLEPDLNLYHFVVGAIYLFPMSVIGFKMVRDRNIGGLPLFICSGMVGIWAIALHLKMNLGVDYGFYSGRITEIVSMVLLLVAVPVSFYIYARSVGCENSRNLKAILIFPVFVVLFLVVTGIFGDSGGFDATLVFSFLFVLGPVSGGLYIWEIMSKDS